MMVIQTVKQSSGNYVRDCFGWAATPPQGAASQPPNGGNCTTRGSDTPATRRKRASCSAKPPLLPAWRASEAPEGPEGTGRLRGAAPNEVRTPSLAGGRALRRPEHQRGHTATRSRPAPQGPGGSRIRPLGGSQRLFQRICVPAAPRRWQASTTRAAMPASADLPHVRGSYCFFTPTSPSILRTPS